MNAYIKKQKQKQRKSIFRKWHRRIGFATAIFVINLSITGILLNHYDALELHKSYVHADWVLDAYQIKPPKDISCFKVDSLMSCQVGELIYVDGHLVDSIDTELLGAHLTGNTLTLVTSKSLLFLTDKVEVIDKLNIEDSLGFQIKAAYIKNNQLLVSHDSGFSIFDHEAEEWIEASVSQSDQHPTSNHDHKLVPIHPYKVSDVIHLKLQADYRKHQITWLTFIQDLHSGRIFTTAAIILNDITAIALILLVISGFITWQRRKNTPNES